MNTVPWRSIGRLRGVAHPACKQLHGRVHNGRDLRTKKSIESVVRQLSSGSVPFLFEHGTQEGFGSDKPIGRVASARETHAGGIEVEIELGPAGCLEAERAAEMLRTKTHTELSLAHAYEQLDASNMAGEGDYSHDVLEVSLVKDGGRRDCTIGQWTEEGGTGAGPDCGTVAASLLTTYKKEGQKPLSKADPAIGIEPARYKGTKTGKIPDRGVVLSSLQLMSDQVEVPVSEVRESPPSAENEPRAVENAKAEIQDPPPVPTAAAPESEASGAGAEEAPDASPNDSQITLAEFEEVCGIAQGLREQLDAARAQAAQEKTAAQASLKAEKAATEQLQTHKAKLLADETRKAKETLQELRKKLASGNASSKSKDSSGKAGAGDLDSDAMDVDPGLVSDSLTRIKDLEARLEQSQTALKRFADPQKSNMMGNAPPTHAAKRQKLDSAHHAPSLGAKDITRKTDSDRGVVTASRLGYEAEDSDTCALRDASVCAVREGKLDLREFNQQMAQLHSNMGLQSNDGGVVRANSDRYRADGASDGPLGLEFGYNLRDQNPQMLSRIQGMVNQRTARDLIHGAQTTLHHTQRYAQQLY